ncbi:DUF6176 family protein [Halomarina pelagica]|uniref:DUF6176 family protein n=1 Tax=Halomarina pelagica TaxID=2961599 RepID=UPI0020C3CBFC|nr:DUF6176 family protein [Halomarina sp. BND7]
MDVILLRYEIPSDRINDLRKLFSEAKNRESEVADILQREEMLTESIFLEEGPDVSYLLWYMETPDIEKAWETYEEATDALIAESREVMEEALNIDFHSAVSECECLFHAGQRDRPAVIQ